ncbi:MAG: lytic murein transglycosylase [Desulfobacteraceae bacterium]|nr:lytic murein transglycosylase [Desulfobacteraceae bacterium]
MRKSAFVLFPFCSLLLLTPPALPAEPATGEPLAAELVTDGQKIDISSPRYQELFAELESAHGFTKAELDSLFSGLTINRRVLELMDRQWEAQPYYKYYPLFIKPELIAKGKEKLIENAAVLEEIEQKLGVEREIVVAIWGIETRFGEMKGGFGVFQTLNTLFDAYPRRRDFFRNQLVELLLLARENHLDPMTLTGSYAGAFGQTQFIPSSYRSYAVDFDGDGRRDTVDSVPDVLASIANYLKQFGWTYGQPVYRDIGSALKDERLKAAYNEGRNGKVDWHVVQKAQGVAMLPATGPVTVVGLEQADGTMRYVAGYPNFQAITAWNHSNRYAMAVAELAESFRK